MPSPSLHSVRTLVDNTRGLIFTESPRWREGKFWFLDIHGQAVKTVDLAGNLETALTLPFKPNSFGIRSDGSLLMGHAFERKIYRWDGQALSPYADIAAHTVFCLSDGIVDTHNRMYVGDIGYNFLDPNQKPVETCVIVCIEPDGSSRVVANGLNFPNGMVITPDGKTLIAAECTGNRLTAFDILPNGDLANKRCFANLPGVQPDGICLDAEGAIWLANPEGEHAVWRVCEGAVVAEKIALDTHAYAVMLGGPERKHLLICTSDSHNPMELAQRPSATLRVLDVAVAGAGTP